jgi:predicted nucleic acid-binding protein
MTFVAIGAGASVFLDANTLIYHFSGEPQYGAACTDLIQRIAQRQVQGLVSTHVLGDVAHRLMTLEAMKLMGWPFAGLAARLRKHRAEIPKLSVYRQAIAAIPNLGIQIAPVSQSLIESAVVLSGQYELLMGDALILAVMRASGIANLASNDADFDRVPGITRHSPV